MNIDRPLMESLMRIRNMPEFEAFKKHLNDELEKHVKALMTLNEDRPVHVAQGCARALKELLDLIERSPDLLDKERRRTGI